MLIRKVGRPRVWNSPDDMINDFNNYVREASSNTNQFNKVDFIKAGQLAGQIVELPAKVWLSLEGFCAFCGVLKQTFDNYLTRNDENNSDFFGVANMIRDIVRQHQIDLAANGLVDSNITAMLNNLKQRQDVTTNDNEIQIAQIKFSTE